MKTDELAQEDIILTISGFAIVGMRPNSTREREVN